MTVIDVGAVVVMAVAAEDTETEVEVVADTAIATEEDPTDKYFSFNMLRANLICTVHPLFFRGNFQFLSNPRKKSLKIFSSWIKYSPST